MRKTALRGCVCWLDKRGRAMRVVRRKLHGPRKDSEALVGILVSSPEKWVSENKGV